MFLEHMNKNPYRPVKSILKSHSDNEDGSVVVKYFSCAIHCFNLFNSRRAAHIFTQGSQFPDAGFTGKLDGVRQRCRWHLQGIQKVHLAFWQPESGRE